MHRIKFGFVAFFFLLLFSMNGLGQEKKKIIFIGSIHFDPSTTDLNHNRKVDLFSASKQKQVDDFVNLLLRLHPDKICIENTPEQQSLIDSAYTKYLHGNYQPNPVIKDEIEQIAFDLAKKAKISKLSCVNNIVSLNYDSLISEAGKCGLKYLLDSSNAAGLRLLNKINEAFESQSLIRAFSYLNSKSLLSANLELYLKYLSMIACRNSYQGNNLISEWYRRNLNIYTNIVNTIKPGGKVIVVLFGAGHIPILKHYFENNSDFEILELNKVLKQ